MSSKKVSKIPRSGRTIRPVPTGKFVVDCGLPGSHEIFDIPSFEKFLNDRIKVNNKAGVLGDNVVIVRDTNSVSVTSKVPLAKRYIKMLTKKFLKKQHLRDHIRVIASNKESYILRYYKKQQMDDEEEQEE